MTEKKSCIVSLRRLEDGSAKIRMEIPARSPNMPFPFQVSIVIDPEMAGRLDRSSLKSVEYDLLCELNAGLMEHMEELRRGHIIRQS